MLRVRTHWETGKFAHCLYLMSLGIVSLRLHAAICHYPLSVTRQLTQNQWLTSHGWWLLLCSLGRWRCGREEVQYAFFLWLPRELHGSCGKFNHVVELCLARAVCDNAGIPRRRNFAPSRVDFCRRVRAGRFAIDDDMQRNALPPASGRDPTELHAACGLRRSCSYGLR